MPEGTLHLLDTETCADLRTFLSRARAALDGAVRIEAVGTALAVTVPVLEPGADAGPLVLGMRVAPLAVPARCVGVYPLGALTDRLARDGEPVLPLPPAEVVAPWAGVAAPRGGWERVAEYDDGALRRAARDGASAVSASLPPHAGAPVLGTVRSRIWSSPVERAAGGAAEPPLPAGAAFAADVLGFLSDGGTSTQFAAGPWLRLSSRGGHVLARSTTLLA